MSTVIAYETLLEGLKSAPARKIFITRWESDRGTQSITFGDFRHLAEVQARYLFTKGLSPGERVILIMPQSVELMACFVGAMMLGAVPSILAFPNDKVEPGKYMSGLSGVSANLRAGMVVLDSSFPSHMLNYITAGNGTRIVRTNDVSSVPCVPLPKPDINADSLAFIQHSSGTTGLQKSVALSHGAVLRNLNNLHEALELKDNDCIYSWLPLYHDMGLVGCFIFPLIYHISVVMQSPMDWVKQPGSMLRLITEHQCTLAWIPNFTFQFLARRVPPEERAAYNLSSLRCLINCSEPVRARSMDEFLAAFSPFGMRFKALHSSYGMAENVFAITQSNLRDGPRRFWVDRNALRAQNIALPVHEDDDQAVCLVSSGSCLANNTVRIVSSEGNDVPEGTLGEILVHSDSMFDGYYNHPELTAKVMSYGWLHSGDLGFRFGNEIFVVGRIKDMMVVAGKNIYPQDVEEIAFSHPSIRDGRAIAFSLPNSAIGTEEIFLVAEAEKEDLVESSSIARRIRNLITAELGVPVSGVYIKPPGWIIKSTAGKSGRALTRDKLIAEHPEEFLASEVMSCSP